MRTVFRKSQGDSVTSYSGVATCDKMGSGWCATEGVDEGVEGVDTNPLGDPAERGAGGSVIVGGSRGRADEENVTCAEEEVTCSSLKMEELLRESTHRARMLQRSLISGVYEAPAQLLADPMDPLL
jgi:hypothetical protein